MFEVVILKFAERGKQLNKEYSGFGMGVNAGFNYFCSFNAMFFEIVFFMILKSVSVDKGLQYKPKRYIFE